MPTPKKRALEVFKFGVYLVIPVVTVFYFSTPEGISNLIKKKRYIIFPPEGDRPPTGNLKEIREAMRDRNGEPEPAAAAALAEPAPEEIVPKQSWTQWLLGQK